MPWFLRTFPCLALASVLLMRCGSETGSNVRHPGDRPPNVLLVVWDTTRADRLSLDGHDVATTPWLASFARECVVYERALSPGIWTLPAHASLFTGLAPSAHGVTTTHKWLDGRFVTLAELLSDAGFDTYAFSANPFVSETFNLVQGFATVEHPFDARHRDAVARHRDAKRIPGDRGLVAPRGGTPTAQEEDARFKECAPVLNDAFLGWLDRRDPERPFFAFLNYMEPHVPRTPSLESRRAVMSEARFRKSLEVLREHLLQLAAMVGKHAFTDDEITTIRAVYDASLRDLDRATEALLEGLRERGVLEDTVVVLTSDHGENLGDHGLFDHKFCVYDTLLHVPLLLRHPATMRLGRVEDPVSTIDLFATILDAAGVAAPETRTQSVSLLRSDAASRREAPIVSEMTGPTVRSLQRVKSAFGEFDWTPWLRTHRAVRRGPWKLIRSSDGSRELYDVVADPGETRDLLATSGTVERSAGDGGRIPSEKGAAAGDPPLASDNQGVAAELERALDAWLADFDPYDPSLSAEEAGRGRLPRDLIEELRALGYAGDGE